MMLIPVEALTALLQAGVMVRPAGTDRVELVPTDGMTPVTVTVQRRSSSLAPSHVNRQDTPPHGRPLLLIAPAASDAAFAAAARRGWSVIALNPESRGGPSAHLRLPDGDVIVGARSHAGMRAPRQAGGPRPWGTFAVVRHLLLSPAAPQTEIAARMGLTQARVSQTLRRLQTEGLLRRDVVGGRVSWQIVDRAALIRWWLEGYPGPGGVTTYWYGLAAPEQQVRSAVPLLAAAGRAAVSGDVAADLIAPWRRPARAVLYAELPADATPADLTAANLTPSGPDEATVELVVPADRSIFSGLTWTQPPDPLLPLADMLQVVWDVRRAHGADTDEAVAALLSVLGQPRSGRAPDADR